VDDDPTTEELRLQQADRERSEHARAAAASNPEDERAAQRRAEKAGYLKKKLDEQAASEE
jgi:5,10-methylenetetrahydrofolate reductase